jgi:hypothetical protein
LKQRGAHISQLPQDMGFGYEDGRLSYPIRNRDGHIVAIERRALSADIFPKCLCDKSPKGAGVFFIGETFRKREIHICEGVMDCVALTTLGFNAIALCGGGLPGWLVKACAFQTVTLAFDADKAGDETASRWTAALEARGAQVHRLRPPDEGKDWGDYLALGLPVLKDAFWRVQGVSEGVRAMRRDFNRLHEKIVYLRTHERTERYGRETLLARLSSDMEDFARACDLPGGYSDPADPCADTALDVLRWEMDALMEAEQPFAKAA